MSQEPVVTAIARSRGTRRGAAGTALLVLAADQASKSLVMTASPAGDGGGPVSVRLVHNSGASFGIGAGHPLLITLTAAVVLTLALVLLARTRSRAVALSLGAVAGGAAGNLADRLLRGPGLGSGSVVDWIHLAIYPATFNLADVAIRLGALCALIAYLRAATPVPPPARDGGSAATSNSAFTQFPGQPVEVRDPLGKHQAVPPASKGYAHLRSLSMFVGSDHHRRGRHRRAPLPRGQPHMRSRLQRGLATPRRAPPDQEHPADDPDYLQTDGHPKVVRCRKNVGRPPYHVGRAERRRNRVAA